MRRKGFLAALLGFVAAPVLAKAKPKAKFPRFFVQVAGRRWTLFAKDVLYVEWRLERELVFVRSAQQTLFSAPFSHRETIEHCVGVGDLREIAAAEAEALLRPKRVTFFKSRTPGFSCVDLAALAEAEKRRYPLGTRRIGPDGHPQIYCKAQSCGLVRRGGGTK